MISSRIPFYIGVQELQLRHLNRFKLNILTQQRNNAFGNVRLSYSLTRKSTGAFRFKAIKAKFSWRIVESENLCKAACAV